MMITMIHHNIAFLLLAVWDTGCKKQAKTKTALAAADRPTVVDTAVLLVLPRFTTVFGMGTGGSTAPLATSTVL